MRKTMLVVKHLCKLISKPSGKHSVLALVFVLLSGNIPCLTQSSAEFRFDISLHDNSSGSSLRLNSVTGAYQFILANRGNQVIEGIGTSITRGCIVTLQNAGGNHRVRASINTHSKIGTASIQVFSLGLIDNIRDTNINDCCFVSLEQPPPAVIIPLYVYPGTGGVNWNPLVEARRNHPFLTVWAIINIDSGPGTQAQFETDYKDAIKLLRNNNIRMLGYVATTDGRKPEEDVKTEINRWQSYNELLAEDTNTRIVFIEGIFFDEMSNNVDCRTTDSSDPTCRTYYEHVSNYARDANHSFNFTVGNLGVKPRPDNPQAAAELADTMTTLIIKENGSPSFFLSEGDFTNLPPAASRGKWGILIHSLKHRLTIRRMPPFLTDEEMALAKRHVRYIYATDDCFNSNLRRCEAVPECNCADPPDCTVVMPKCPGGFFDISTGFCIGDTSCVSPWDTIAGESTGIATYLDEFFSQVENP